MTKSSKQILGLVDGWPAALTFALRTSTRASDLRAVSAGTREMVYRYLAEQVWHSLDDRMRGFLRTAAFLPRLETRLAVAAGFDDAAAIIESLRERVAFISVLDAGVYKLHDLFRDFVQRQIQLEGDEALRAAQVTAGRLLEKMQMFGEALERFVDARAAAEVERVLAAYNFALLEKGCFDIVERALRSLPAAVGKSNPRVLALRAAIEDAHGRVDQAERWYAAVLERLNDDVAFRVAVAIRYALLLYQQGRFDGVPVLESLRERDDLDPPERATVLGMLAMTYALAGWKDGGARRNHRSAGARRVRRRGVARAHLRARRNGRVLRLRRRRCRVLHPVKRHAWRSRSARSAQRRGSSARWRRCTPLRGASPVAAWFAAQIAANAEKAGDPQIRARTGCAPLMQLEAERGNAERVAEVERELAVLAYRGPIGLIGYLYGKALALGWTGQFREAQILLSSVADRDLTPYQNRLRFGLWRARRGAVVARRSARGIGSIRRRSRRGTPTAARCSTAYAAQPTVSRSSPTRFSSATPWRTRACARPACRRPISNPSRTFSPRC